MNWYVIQYYYNSEKPWTIGFLIKEKDPEAAKKGWLREIKNKDKLVFLGIEFLGVADTKRALINTPNCFFCKLKQKLKGKTK